MADTKEFFESFLPAKLGDSDIDGSFLFKIEGAGTWLVVPSENKIEEGGEDADCVITCGKDDWEAMLDDTSLVMQLFMTGKLTASNLGMATQLQGLLG